MKLKLSLCATLLAALSLASCQPQTPTASNSPAGNSNAQTNSNAAGGGQAKKPPVDLEQVAQRIVTQSAGVKEGEVVLIGGYAQDQELLENIAVNVRKVGAFPLVELYSDRMEKRMYADVPEQFDTQTNALALKLADIADVTINVTGSTTQGLFADADPKRVAARGKAGEPVAQAYLRNNVRSVEVGNGFYPTAWRAERFGMSEDDLAKTFWEGVNLDYQGLQARGEEVRAALAAGGEVHITNPNGTDVRFRLQGKPVLVSDGIISDEDKRKGGAAVSVYLPAGEVYTTPVAGTAEGTVVHTRDFFNGKEVRNVRMTFAGGKLTSMTGEGEGFALLKAQYDATEGRKDEFSSVDLGINPNIKLPATSTIGNWVPAGTITVGCGNNSWAGGDNNVAFGYVAFLPGSTVTLDGRVIIENGVLKI